MDGLLLIKKSRGTISVLDWDKNPQIERVIAFCQAVGLNLINIADLKIENEEGNTYYYSEIRFSSGNVKWERSMAKDLIKWGMAYYSAGDNGERVKINNLPHLREEQLMLSFLLGFYDGDGSLRKYIASNGNIYVSPQICSANKVFLEKLRRYFGIKNKIYCSYKEKINCKTGKIYILKLYQLTLGIQLFEKMIKTMKNSMERKRTTRKSFYMTTQRKWLLRVLAREKLEEILKILPINTIAEIMGISHSVIKRFAQIVYDLEIPRYRDNSEQKVNYWKNYLEKIGKFLNE